MNIEFIQDLYNNNLKYFSENIMKKYFGYDFYYVNNVDDNKLELLEINSLESITVLDSQIISSNLKHNPKSDIIYHISNDFEAGDFVYFKPYRFISFKHNSHYNDFPDKLKWKDLNEIIYKETGVYVFDVYVDNIINTEQIFKIWEIKDLYESRKRVD